MAAFPAPFAGHLYRKTIDLDSTKVSADKTDHDVVLKITDLDLRDHANANGLDIQFSDSADNILDFELIEWVPGSGLLEAWIKVPSLSSSSDTEVKVYYGKPTATDQSDPAGLWTATAKPWEYVAHLQESGTGVSGEYVNSVGNGHATGGGFDGTTFGVNTTPTRDGGTADAVPFASHYQDFPGPQSADDNIAALGVWPEHDVPWATMTSFIWFAQSTTDIDARLWGLSYGAGGTDQTMFHGNNLSGAGVFKYRLNSDTTPTQQADLGPCNADDSWNLNIISIDFGKTGEELTSFLDGAFDENNDLTGATFETAPDIDYRTIGNSGVIFSRCPQGGIVEVRLREDPSDLDDASIWWENQSNPGAFHTFNAEETNDLFLIGNAAGTTTAVGALIGRGKMIASAAGATVAAGVLIGVGFMVASAAGTTIADGSIIGIGQMSAAAAGSTVGEGVLSQGAVVGSAAGSTVAAGALIGHGFMTASAAGRTLRLG